MTDFASRSSQQPSSQSTFHPYFDPSPQPSAIPTGKLAIYNVISTISRFCNEDLHFRMRSLACSGHVLHHDKLVTCYFNTLY